MKKKFLGIPLKGKYTKNFQKYVCKKDQLRRLKNFLVIDNEESGDP